MTYASHRFCAASLLAALTLCFHSGCDDSSGSSAVAPDAAVADASPDMAPADAAAPAEARFVLNEVRCRAPAFVELQNVGDSAGSPERLRLRVGEATVALPDVPVSPGARLQVPWAVPCATEVALSYDGEAVDAVSPALDVEVASFGRLPDGVGDWARTLPTPGAENLAFALPGAALFQSNRVVDIALTAAEDQVDWLGGQSRTAIVGGLRLDGGEVTPASLRVVGDGGRIRRGDQKALFVVRFDSARLPEAERSAPFGGLQTLVLDNVVLDPAVLTSWLAAQVLQTAGVDGPRIGFANVTLNGAPVGLYAVTEAYDATYAAYRYPTTGHIWTTVGSDLVVADVEGFEATAGDPYDRRDLLALASLHAQVGPDGYYDASGDLLRWPEIVRTLAVESVLGSRDGYAVDGDMLSVHLDVLGRAALLPEGLDLALRAPGHLHRGEGMLLSRCLVSAECRAAYDEALATLAGALAERDWRTETLALAELLRGSVVAQPGDWSVEMFDAAVLARVDALEARIEEVAGLSICLDTSVDTDGDDAICDEDCAPDDRSVHALGLDACEGGVGDGVDQDCDGVADNGPGCAIDCVPGRRGAHGYLFCPAARTWAEADALCRDLGMTLATVDAAEENEWLFERAQSVGGGYWWFGLNDRDEEGHFVWADGAEPTFTYWADGEPNNWRDLEDCGHFYSDGHWNDIDCSRRFSAICEAPCVAGTDVDGDGVPGCGVDCDDDEASANLEGVEVCGDGIDQDCNGVVDDGEGCGCAERQRGEQTYLFCAEPVSFEAAATLCGEYGMKMAAPADAAENAWIYDTAREVRAQVWWLGLSDVRTEGRFVHADGTFARWLNWRASQPNDVDRNQDCAYLFADGPEWNDGACDETHAVVCVD